MKKFTAVTLFLMPLLAASLSPAYAAEFQSEVLALKGQATATDLEGTARPLKQGDLLKKGEQIEVGENSHVDLAFDKDWKNVTRLESNTKAKITSIEPGKLDLKDGGIFARLKKLPQSSSFEIRTPSAVATVRGSEYRTTHLLGQTDVFNAGSSRVVVYGVSSNGSADKNTAVMLEKDKKSSVPDAAAPTPAVDVSEEEKGASQVLMGGIETNVEKAEKEGRSASIQSVEEIEQFIREEKKKALAAAAPAPEAELSRVTDTRRRPFAGGDAALAPPEKEEPAGEPEPPTQEIPNA